MNKYIYSYIHQYKYSSLRENLIFYENVFTNRQFQNESTNIHIYIIIQCDHPNFF